MQFEVAIMQFEVAIMQFEVDEKQSSCFIIMTYALGKVFINCLYQKAEVVYLIYREVKFFGRFFLPCLLPFFCQTKVNLFFTGVLLLGQLFLFATLPCLFIFFFFLFVVRLRKNRRSVFDGYLIDRFENLPTCLFR